MESLWGEFNIEKIETPKNILESQASFLPKLTKRKVYAAVCQEEKIPAINLKKDFNYGFYLKSDYLNNYSYKVLTVHHDIELYPLFINVSDELRKEVEGVITLNGVTQGNLVKNQPQNAFIVNNIKEFKETIGFILQSEKVKSVISSLASLATDEDLKF